MNLFFETWVKIQKLPTEDNGTMILEGRTSPCGLKIVEPVEVINSLKGWHGVGWRQIIPCHNIKNIECLLNYRKESKPSRGHKGLNPFPWLTSHHSVKENAKPESNLCTFGWTDRSGQLLVQEVLSTKGIPAPQVWGVLSSWLRFLTLGVNPSKNTVLTRFVNKRILWRK